MISQTRYGDIQKVNTDTTRRSAQVKFKTVEEAESAANAFFNKPRDEHILGVPQIRVKYVMAAPYQEGGDL